MMPLTATPGAAAKAASAAARPAAASSGNALNETRPLTQPNLFGEVPAASTQPPPEPTTELSPPPPPAPPAPPPPAPPPPPASAGGSAGMLALAPAPTMAARVADALEKLKKERVADAAGHNKSHAMYGTLVHRESPGGQDSGLVPHRRPTGSSVRPSSDGWAFHSVVFAAAVLASAIAESAALAAAALATCAALAPSALAPATLHNRTEPAASPGMPP